MEKEKEKKAADTPEAPQAADEKKEASPEKADVGKASRKKEAKAEKAAQTAALEQEVEKLKKELAETKDTYQRWHAGIRQLQTPHRTGKGADRAVHQGGASGQVAPHPGQSGTGGGGPCRREYKSGVDMTIRQFHEALIALGLEEIPADNQPFDPEVHHAVMREDADGVEPDTVTQVFQKGYRGRRTAVASGYGQGSQLKRDEISFFLNTIYHLAYHKLGGN